MPLRFGLYPDFCLGKGTEPSGKFPRWDFTREYRGRGRAEGEVRRPAKLRFFGYIIDSIGPYLSAFMIPVIISRISIEFAVGF